MGGIYSNRPAASCAGCLAWGGLDGRYCHSCYSFGRNHDAGDCSACHRTLPVKKGYCRLCWNQASLEAKGQVTVLQPFLERITHQQLFFVGMHRIRQPGPLLGKQGRRRSTPRATPSPPIHVRGAAQRRLLDVPKDFTRFDRRQHADLTNPWLAQARRTARSIGEARGWTRWVANDVDRALVILLSGHTDGDKIRYSELLPALRPHGLSVGRTVEVLDHIGVFDDDRVPAIDTWLDRKLADIAPGIRHDVEAWARSLVEGSQRSRPRQRSTAWGYLYAIQPVLADWSNHHDHLREVTRDEIVAVRDALQGAVREITIVALRSLFRFCKKTGRVFRDPTSRVHVARKPDGVLLPLEPEDVSQAVTTATTAADRLIIALAGIYAARPKAIRQLLLEDVDLGNRRLMIAGQVRPLDDLTRRAILAWLDYRRSRWPNTANPHLLVTQHTAMESRPVGKLWVTKAVRGLAATLERLRVDRQLDEALTHGPDPLHLAAVFGLDERTAIRYASAARQLLTTRESSTLPPAHR